MFVGGRFFFLILRINFIIGVNKSSLNTEYVHQSLWSHLPGSSPLKALLETDNATEKMALKSDEPQMELLGKNRFCVYIGNKRGSTEILRPDLPELGQLRLTSAFQKKS